MVLDAILHHGESYDTQLPIYNACSDFFYVGQHHHPRLGAGSFKHVLENVYSHIHSNELKQVLYGKPMRTSFDYVTRLLEKQKESFGHTNPLQTLYMVGDNPDTDIKGANDAGGRWKSILTETGIYQSGDPHTAHHVRPSIANLVDYLNLQQSST